MKRQILVFRDGKNTKKSFEGLKLAKSAIFIVTPFGESKKILDIHFKQGKNYKDIKIYPRLHITQLT